MPRRAILILTCAIPVAIGGCGSSKRSAAICKAGARQLISRTLGVSQTRVTEAAARGNNQMPQCSFTAHLSGGTRFEVTVNVDTSPQPYAVLSRTIEERQQVFSPTRLVPAPIAVLHLGLLASWFPDDRLLMSTDGVRLVTTTLAWRGAKQGQEIRFAAKISRLYLGRSRPSLAKLSP